MSPAHDTDFLFSQQATPITVALEPVYNVLTSMMLILHSKDLSGISSWINETAEAMSAAQLHTHRVVLIGLHQVLLTDCSWSDFPSYLDDMLCQDAVVLRDRLLYTLVHINTIKQEPTLAITPEKLLENVEGYLGYLQSAGFEFEVDIEREAYGWLSNPPEMQRFIISHLRELWQEVFAAEWNRVKPQLQESVQSFQQLNFSGLTAVEAIKIITGRDVSEKWGKTLNSARRIICVPSAHVGPYLWKFHYNGIMWVIFGARLPEGLRPSSSALTRSELLVRLSALSDDTRLAILALLSQYEELRAQDIIERLNLSQSAASRHLRHLSATAYITERWHDGAKCYSLNRDRIDATTQALQQFLSAAI